MPDGHDRIAQCFQDAADEIATVAPSLARVFRAHAAAELDLRQYDPQLYDRVTVHDRVLRVMRQGSVTALHPIGSLWHVTVRFDDDSEQECTWAITMSPRYKKSLQEQEAAVEAATDDHVVMF